MHHCTPKLYDDRLLEQYMTYRNQLLLYTFTTLAQTSPEYTAAMAAPQAGSTMDLWSSENVNKMVHTKQNQLEWMRIRT